VPKGRGYERIQRGKVISNVEQVDEKALSVDLCDWFRQSWLYRFILATFYLLICLSNFGLLHTFVSAVSYVVKKKFGLDATRFHAVFHDALMSFHPPWTATGMYQNSIKARRPTKAHWDRP
jgi:hypothetical protein